MLLKTIKLELNQFGFFKKRGGAARKLNSIEQGPITECQKLKINNHLWKRLGFENETQQREKKENALRDHFVER